MDTPGEISFVIFLIFIFGIHLFFGGVLSERDDAFIAGAIIVFIFYQVFIKDEITLYSQSQICTNTDNCYWANNNRLTFKVIEESQQVVYWDTAQLTSMVKNTDCTIRDRKNWWCQKIDGEIMGIFDGEWTYTKGGVYINSSEDFREVWMPWWWVYWVIESV